MQITKWIYFVVQSQILDTTLLTIVVCGQPPISGSLNMSHVSHVSARQYDSVIPGYRNNRQPRWSCNSMIDPMPLTEATNLLWHPYIQCTDAQALKHTPRGGLNTCSQWNAHRRQSDFIRETCGVSFRSHKYTVHVQLEWIYACANLQNNHYSMTVYRIFRIVKHILDSWSIKQD